jgi:hypothetical protein
MISGLDLRFCWKLIQPWVAGLLQYGNRCHQATVLLGHFDGSVQGHFTTKRTI